MNISPTMNLQELAERMGWNHFHPDDIDWESVRTMRGLLVDGFNGANTQDISHDEWARLLDRSQGN